MRKVRFAPALILVLFSLASKGTGADHQHSVGGSIDHVRILVRDISDSREAYEKLGFEFGDARPLILPEGSSHYAMWLKERTYLELLGVADRERLSKERPWIVDFIARTQGCHSVGITVDSAKELSDRLRAGGVDAPVSALVSKPGVEPILHVTPKLPHLPEGVIFFTQKHPQRASVSHDIRHANTSERILAVWIVVHDLSEAAKDMRRLGFPLVRSVESPTLGARGQEFATEHGYIVLLQGSDNGPVKTFAHERQEGLMGVTVGVIDLDKARSLVERNSRRKLPIYTGFYGKSFLVPADLGSGAWIEMTTEPRNQ